MWGFGGKRGVILVKLKAILTSIIGFLKSKKTSTLTIIIKGYNSTVNVTIKR